MQYKAFATDAAAAGVDILVLPEGGLGWAPAEGEYGLEDVALSVPCKLGEGGVQEIVELDLNEETRQALAVSAEPVRALFQA